MLYIVTGAPCSGKTTYVQEHKQDTDVVIDLDFLAQALGSKDLYEHPRAIKATALSARKQAIKTCIENNFNAWVVDTKPSKESIETYKQAKAEFIALDIDEETCLQRCEQENRPQQTREAIEQYFHSKGGKMKTKEFNVEVKEAGEEKHSITAYASTFDRIPDSYGDVVAKGAFADFIAKIEETGEKIPLLFGHRTDDPMMNIGVITSVEEDEKGLKVTADFDMDNPNGAYAYKLVKEGRLYKLSFAYEVLDECPVELEDGIKANELRKMNVYEVSLVPIPANQNAQVVEVKTADIAKEIVEKYGEEIAEETKIEVSQGLTDKLKKIQELAQELDKVISELEFADDTEDDTNEVNDEVNAAAEEQKSEELKSAILTTLIDIELTKEFKDGNKA
jgi:uncharacterized protein